MNVQDLQEIAIASFKDTPENFEEIIARSFLNPRNFSGQALRNKDIKAHKDFVILKALMT